MDSRYYPNDSWFINLTHNTLQKQVIELSKSTNTFLKNNPHILITKADKSNIIVAMDRNKYISEATLIFSDKKTYQLSRKDPRNITHNKVNNLKNLWRKKDYITDSVTNSLKSHNPLPTRFYVLPKIHKPDHPLRPIVSFCGSPTHNLASFITTLFLVTYLS